GAPAVWSATSVAAPLLRRRDRAPRCRRLDGRRLADLPVRLRLQLVQLGVGPVRPRQLGVAAEAQLPPRQPGDRLGAGQLEPPVRRRGLELDQRLQPGRAVLDLAVLPRTTL